MRTGPAGKSTILWGALLFLAVLAAFWPATRAGFIWDDDVYVTGNRTLADAHGLSRIWFEPGAVPQYYPLVHTTFWIEHHLWGTRPFGYHLVNILLHAGGCLFFWACLRRLGVPGAWAAAAIYALHPLQVESVAWITERKNVLSGLFMWASFLAFWRVGEERGEGAAAGTGGRLPDARYGLSILLFLFALLSKTVAGSLPVILLLANYWKSGRITKRDLVRLVPFVLLALVLGTVTILMERGSVGAVGPEWALSFVQRLGVAGRVLWFYPLRLLWPHPLSFIYARWDAAAGVGSGMLRLAAFLGLLGALFGLRNRLGRAPFAAVLAYSVAIFPALGFFNLFPMRYSWVADHFQYLAGAPLIAAGVGGAAAGAARWAWAGRIPRAIVLGGLLLLCGGSSYLRTRVYLDEETLWRDTLRNNPGAWMAHHNLGKYYEGTGRTDLAVAEYRSALRIRPDLDTSLFNLGNVLAARGNLDEAGACLRRALEANPQFVEAANNLGNVLFRQKRLEEASAMYKKAVELDSSYAEAHRNLAYLQAEMGNLHEAVAHLKAALRLQPDDQPTLNRLAWLLATSTDPQVRNGAEAVTCALRASRLSGMANPNYLSTLSAAYAEAGRYPEAIETVQKALALTAPSGREELTARLQTWLRQYQAGRPIRYGS